MPAHLLPLLLQMLGFIGGSFGGRAAAKGLGGALAGSARPGLAKAGGLLSGTAGQIGGDIVGGTAGGLLASTMFTDGEPGGGGPQGGLTETLRLMEARKGTEADPENDVRRESEMLQALQNMGIDPSTLAL